MRVLTITNLYPNPFEPNRATFNRQQVRALSELVPVRVISPISWMDELWFRVHKRPGLPRGRRMEFDGITVDHPRFVYPPKILRGTHGGWYRWSIRSLFRALVKEFKPDILFAPWAYPDGWATVQLGREAGLPVVIKLHGCDLLYGLSHVPSRLPGTIEAVCGAHGIVSVSQDLAQHASRMGVMPDRMCVVYDGVDAETFYPGSRDEARRKLGLPADEGSFLFVGGLLPVKGLDILLQACSLLQKRNVAFKMRLVGEGAWRDNLTQQLDVLGIKECVVLHGSRPHGALGDWFRAADVFVLPSRSEGVPCVLLEAMACGKPFVASRVGGIPEVAHLGDGILVPAENPAVLADALERQLQRARAATGMQASPPRSHAQAAAEILAFFEKIRHMGNAGKTAPIVPRGMRSETREFAPQNGARS